MKKRMISLLLAALLVLGLLPATTLAADNLSWSYDDNGNLTISGSGAMSDYSAASPAPWAGYANAITHVTIHSGVTSIGDNAFAGLNSLRTIDIPSTVTSIGDYAFYRCDTLQAVDLPTGLTAIGSCAFYGCQDLTRVIIPYSMRTLGSYAFYGCQALNNLTILNGITTIGDSAFAGSGLVSVTIPASVTTIGENAFAQCDKLTAIAVNSSNTAYTSDGTALYNRGMTTLYRVPGGFQGSFTIPASVTTVAPYALSYCGKLSGVTISQGVSQLGDYAFYACPGLTQISLPASLSHTGMNTFGRCANLTGFTLASGNANFSVDSYGALYNAARTILYRVPTRLRGVYDMPETVSQMASYALDGCDGLAQIHLSPALTSIAEGALFGCSSIASVEIPHSCTMLHDYAFYGCAGLAAVTLPEKILSLGREVFGGCAGLKTIHFSGKAPSMGSQAFHGVTATAEYPDHDTSWNTVITGSYGGSIAWTSYHKHSYTATSFSLTCQEYARVEYTCALCGDRYTEYAETQLAPWSETKPTGVSEDLIVSKTQYRYRDYETLNSYDAALAGYSVIGSQWVNPASGSVTYVASWPGGFSTSHALYAKYNNKSSLVTAGETATKKTVVHSDTLQGYLYYHWCYAGDYVSMESMTGSYINFHAYFDTQAPGEFKYDPADGSYGTYRSDICTNSNWYWPVEVYTQSYTTYDKLYTYERWTDYSAWSDTPVTATANRQVQTRTLYTSFICGYGSHSFTNGVCSVCGELEAIPVITPKYPALSFEDEVVIDVFFDAANLGSLTTQDMGLLTWSTPQETGTIDTAHTVISGAQYDSAAGLYRISTKGIPAKNLSDTVYFKLYLRLADGSYLYSKMLSYSPKTYAANVLANEGNDPELRALTVAMLNYGAAAQNYFGYKPYNLANSGLTDSHKALVESYRANMVAAVGQVNSSKIGIFQSTGGFSRKYPSVTFEGAFCIDYFFTPSNTPQGNLKLYYWTQEAYNAATTLTPGNASGCLYMTNDGTGVYAASVTGIAAKDLDGTIYVAAGYSYGGASYCTGVLPYSIGSYCVTHAAGTDTMQPFAAATAVYGYYAKQYFSV